MRRSNRKGVPLLTSREWANAGAATASMPVMLSSITARARSSPVRMCITSSRTGGCVRLGPAGRYQVGYRVVSGDGHPVQGSTSFVLTKAGTGTPPTQPAATGTPVAGGASGASSGGGSPVWPWIAAAVVVIGVGVVVALRLGRT